jgi:hypothetical protein
MWRSMPGPLAMRSDAPAPVDSADVIAALDVIEASRPSTQQRMVVRPLARAGVWQ